jgi:hypothetical protein
MKIKIHRQLCEEALRDLVSADVLQTIINANIGQDALAYQFGKYAHFHYDADSFAAGDAYIAEQRALIVDRVDRGTLEARRAFGRLTHSAQDLYAHSNYAALWIELNPSAEINAIDPLSDQVLRDRRLHSGHLYYPLEALAFIPPIAPLIMPLLPKNSHAHMNIDDPSRPLFEFAYVAALKRTRLEFERVMKALSREQGLLFTGIRDEPQRR